MEWQWMLLLIFCVLVALMLSGMPVAFSFMLINMGALFLLYGGAVGLKQLIVSIFSSVTSFTLLPIPLFIIMGEVLFQSNVGPVIIDIVDKWLGRLPGRLSLLSVSAGTLFATLTGTSMSSVAMLGATLVPDMEKRGYKKAMTLGPIMASGGLAVMIPPSGLAVLCGAIGEISVGKILIAIIVPGLLLAALYAGYIIIRCKLQPSVAPSYEVPKISITHKLALTARYVLPIGIVIFLVIGVMTLGIATPSEAAVTGFLGTIILAAFHRRLNWKVLEGSIASTLQITGMIFLIITGAIAFGQALALSGATRGLSEFVIRLTVAPILIIVGMQIVVLIMGMFMEVVSIMMITLPIFVPVVNALGFSPVWFAVLFLVNSEVALISPPFGMSLFVMKGVAPADTTMGDIYRAALPFIGFILIAMLVIIIFPQVALWLPGLAE